MDGVIINNKIHLLDEEFLKKGMLRYICIYSVYPTFDKSTRIKEKVTCKNCLRKIEKQNTIL